MSRFQDAKYRATLEGRLYVGNAPAAGVVPPIYSATAQVFGLWNPAGSKVNGIICDLNASLVDTTGAAGGFVLAIMKNAGAGLAAGAISAWTDDTPEGGMSGDATGGNTIRFTKSGATVIAPTILRHLGINQLVLTPATTTAPVFRFSHPFKGDLVLPPNAAIFLAGNIATLSKWAPSIKWFEEPRN